MHTCAARCSPAPRPTPLLNPWPYTFLVTTLHKSLSASLHTSASQQLACSDPLPLVHVHVVPGTSRCQRLRPSATPAPCPGVSRRSLVRGSTAGLVV